MQEFEEKILHKIKKLSGSDDQESKNFNEILWQLP